MSHNHGKKESTEELTLSDIKKKLGNRYASRIASKSRQLNNRQVYDVVRGWVTNPRKVNQVLKAAAKVLEEDNRLKTENERLKMSISK